MKEETEIESKERIKKEKKLKELEQEVLKNLNCELKKTAKNLVFGKGNPNAEILLIGEAPGSKEDEQGIPFVGKAGKDLNKELEEIGLNLDQIYIANILKYHPPKNRDPTEDEIKRHTPYLIKQIEIIKPKYIITLGNFATKFTLGKFLTKNMGKIEGITKLHGRLFRMREGEKEFFVFPMYHPSAMVYNQYLKDYFKKDFKKLSKIIETKINKENKNEIQKKLQIV